METMDFTRQGNMTVNSMLLYVLTQEFATEFLNKFLPNLVENCYFSVSRLNGK